MKITQFNKQNLPTIRKKIQESLKSLEDEIGVKFSIGRMTFQSNSFRARLECLIANNEAGAEIDVERLKFNKDCHLFGLGPAHYGREFKSFGQTYKLVGVNPRSRKYPFIGIKDGKRFKFPRAEF